jgi:hypothetical protein
MGWDLWLEIDTGGEEPAQVGKSFNYTYNTGPMLNAAGLYVRGLLGLTAKHAVVILRDVIAQFEDTPCKFKAFDPPNGWGSYDSLLEVLREMVADWSKHPRATVNGSF